MLRPGDLVDERFQIVDFLGEGAFSAVYKARHTSLGIDVALKICKFEQISPLDLERIRNEARILAGLSHKNFAKVYGIGIFESRLFIAMALINGSTLADKVRTNGRIVPITAWPLFLKLCDALEYLHQAGVVHRDIKPSNIMICENLEPIIIDFGLAKTSDPSQKLTREGAILGTPQYMSPELCMGKPAIPQSDIYAFGCLMYECLTGTPLFTGDSNWDIMLKHLNSTLPDMPVFCEKILRDCLEKDPLKRYSSFSRLKVDLESIANLSHDTIVHTNQQRSKEPVLRNTSKLKFLTCGALILFAGIGWMSVRKEQIPSKEVTPALLQELQAEAEQDMNAHRWDQAISKLTILTKARTVPKEKVNGEEKIALAHLSNRRYGEAHEAYERALVSARLVDDPDLALGPIVGIASIDRLLGKPQNEKLYLEFDKDFFRICNKKLDHTRACVSACWLAEFWWRKGTKVRSLECIKQAKQHFYKGMQANTLPLDTAIDVCREAANVQCWDDAEELLLATAHAVQNSPKQIEQASLQSILANIVRTCANQHNHSTDNLKAAGMNLGNTILKQTDKPVLIILIKDQQGALLSVCGDQPGAIKTLESALTVARAKRAESPVSIQVRHRLINLHGTAQNYKEAIRIAKEAIEISNNLHDTRGQTLSYLYLGQWCLITNGSPAVIEKAFRASYDHALERYNEVRISVPHTLDTMEEAVRICDDSAHALASFLLSQNRLSCAREVVEKQQRQHKEAGFKTSTKLDSLLEML